MVNGEERSEIFECLLMNVSNIFIENVHFNFYYNIHHCIIMCDNRFFFGELFIFNKFILINFYYI